MSTDPVIPPPTAADKAIILNGEYQEWNSRLPPDAERRRVGIIRRCHAAEQSLAAIRAERETLAARLKQAEELLRPFADLAAMGFGDNFPVGPAVFASEGPGLPKFSDCRAAAAFLASEATS